VPIIEFIDDDIPSPEHRVELQDLIDATRECGRGLTRWERDFLESVEQ
jgi:hypothetical protein